MGIQDDSCEEQTETGGGLHPQLLRLASSKAPGVGGERWSGPLSIPGPKRLGQAIQHKRKRREGGERPPTFTPFFLAFGLIRVTTDRRWCQEY